MSLASIIYDGNMKNVDLNGLYEFAKERLPYKCELHNLKYLDSIVPQLRIYANKAIALQVENDSEYVPEEVQEMVEDARFEKCFNDETLNGMANCNYRIDLHSCSPANVIELDGQGLLIHDPEDIDPLDVEVFSILTLIKNHVTGYLWDNVNGEWYI